MDQNALVLVLLVAFVLSLRMGPPWEADEQPVILVIPVRPRSSLLQRIGWTLALLLVVLFALAVVW